MTILNNDGVPLSEEDEREYVDDVFDAGIPMSLESAKRLWDKWGERLGLPSPLMASTQPGGGK